MKFESLIEQKSEETLREMLARYDRGERCFVGLDLAGVEMRGTDPRSSGCWAGANLSGADLSGVNLREANLHGTDLTDAIVEHVEWEGVNCALDASI